MQNGGHGAGSRVRGLLTVWVLAVTAGLIASQLLRLRSGPDIDLWLHLRIGDALRRGLDFGTGRDPLVVLADRQYVPSQWLGQELFSGVYEGAGLTGILILRLLLIAALVAAAYLACRLVVDPASAAVSVLLAMIGTAAAWGERPQLIGLVLEAVFVLAWTFTRTRGVVPWLVVPGTWLWACVHGSWVVGLATGLVATIVIGMDRQRRARIRPLIVVVALSVVAAGSTPLGPALLLEPFSVNEIARATVNEWQAPSPSNPLLILVLAMSATVMVRLARQWRTSLPDIVLAFAGGVLAAYSVRTIAFAAVLVAPAFAAAFAGARRETRPAVGVAELCPWLAMALIIAVLPGAIRGVDGEGPLGRATSTALADLPAGSHVAVDVRVSGWVLHAFPELRPLRDLRAEVYSQAAAQRFEHLITGRPGWQEVAEDEQVAAVVADSTGPLVVQLRREGGWFEVAQEKGYALWIPASSAR